MNYYNSATHGVCGWPRPVLGTDRCSCGLTVRRTSSGWDHFVASEPEWMRRKREIGLPAKELTLS